MRYQKQITPRALNRIITVLPFYHPSQIQFSLFILQFNCSQVPCTGLITLIRICVISVVLLR